jgi:hypothetical protein
MSNLPSGIGTVDAGATVGHVESDVTPDPASTALKVKAAENARRVLAKSRAVDERTTAELAREFQEMAAKATGMTVEELLAAKVPNEPASVAPPKPTRESVLNRGVPELHLRNIYDRDPIECDSLARVQEFLGSDMTLLVLSGGVGTRKSGSACYGLVMRAGRYVTADDLSGLAASRDEDGVVSYRQIKKAGLLVIDDLGGEYVDDKGWFVRALNAVIDARYSACLKTILTTNLTAEQFKATYGERIADRIRESGRWRDIGGQSVRRVDSSR